MKKLILLSILVILSGCNGSRPPFNTEKVIDGIQLKEQLWNNFIQALIYVESRGDKNAIGRTNDVGILQITPIYVEDVNRILGEERFTLDCRVDIDKSLEMFEIYQSYYNPDKDINRAIKLHNPGAGSDYREKILSKINELKKHCLNN